MKNKYFSLEQSGKNVDITVYGDITSWDWCESDISSFTLSKAIEALTEVDNINVHINSYGGETAEGLAIYNALKNSPAHVRTICDGFACSAASIVFMAGGDREMNAASLLMIHNAWTYADGNAAQLRKTADDLDAISTAARAAYMAHVNITEDKLVELLDAESWILPTDALSMGFATAIVADAPASVANQSAKRHIIEMLTAKPVPAELTPEPEPKPEPKPDPTPEPPAAENKIKKYMTTYMVGKAGKAE